MKKEELIAELAVQKSQNKEWYELDTLKRKEFAKAFNWYESGRYDMQSAPKLPTWTEIFVELGKLLASRNFRDTEGNISELENKVRALEESLLPSEQK